MLEYLTTSQIENELNLRGYFAATTPPASTPPVTPSVTATQVLIYVVGLALPYISMPITTTRDTYLTAAQWAEVIRVSLSLGPQVVHQYGFSFTLTEQMIVDTLHTIGYYLASPSVTPPASKPTITTAQLIDMCVESALRYYSYSLTSSQRVSISTSMWDDIIEYAKETDVILEPQYTILAGLSGLGVSGNRYCDPLNVDYNVVKCFGPPDVSDPWIGWEIILNMITAGLLTWTQAMKNKRDLSNAGYYFKEPINAADRESRITQLMRLYGWSRSQAEQFEDLGKAPSTNQIPSWVWPFAVGAGVYLIISKR